MKINTNTTITTGTSVMKKMSQADKGTGDTVILGNIKQDDTLLMGDRLKDMKSLNDREVWLPLAEKIGIGTGFIGIGAGIYIGASYSPIIGAAVGVLSALGLSIYASS